MEFGMVLRHLGLTMLLAACAASPLPPVAVLAPPVATLPANPVYQQGVDALARGQLSEALTLWRQYVRETPAGDPRLATVKGHITLLERGIAREQARALAKGEQGSQQADPLHIAILPFGNSSVSTDLRPKKPFNQAVVALITTDLAQVPQLTLLERDKVRWLLEEQKLSRSGLVDPTTAVQTGRLLQAGTVVSGMVHDEDGPAGYRDGRYKINTVLVGVADGRVRATQEAEGAREHFFEVEKEIVYEILQGLDIQNIPTAVAKIHTRDWDAYADFAVGLQHLEAGAFQEARQAFQSALQHDPRFDLARDTLHSTPQRQLTPGEILQEAREMTTTVP